MKETSPLWDSIQSWGFLKALKWKGLSFQTFCVKVKKRQMFQALTVCSEDELLCSWKGNSLQTNTKPPSRLCSFLPALARGLFCSRDVLSAKVKAGETGFFKCSWPRGLLSLSSPPFCTVTLENKSILCKATARFLSCSLCTQNTEKAASLAPVRPHANGRHSKPQGNSYTCTVLNSCLRYPRVTAAVLIVWTIASVLNFVSVGSSPDCAGAERKRAVIIVTTLLSEESMVSWLDEGVQLIFELPYFSNEKTTVMACDC